MIAKTIIVLKLPLRDSSVEVSNRKSAVEGDRIKYSLILASNVKKPGQDTRWGKTTKSRILRLYKDLYSVCNFRQFAVTVNANKGRLYWLSFSSIPFYRNQLVVDVPSEPIRVPCHARSFCDGIRVYPSKRNVMDDASWNI